MRSSKVGFSRFFIRALGQLLYSVWLCFDVFSWLKWLSWLQTSDPHVATLESGKEDQSHLLVPLGRGFRGTFRKDSNKLLSTPYANWIICPPLCQSLAKEKGVVNDQFKYPWIIIYT
jgi:hypothetical protein